MKRGKDDPLLSGSTPYQAGFRGTGEDRGSALRGETDLYHALIDASPENIAVLSSDATIVAVSEAWRRFGRENGNPDLLGAGPGDNYLSACKGNDRQSRLLAQQAHRGVSDVLCRAREHFVLDYPCHSPSEERWYRMDVFRLPGAPEFTAVVHRDTTEYERLRNAVRGRGQDQEISSDTGAVKAVDLAPRQRQVLELLAKGSSNKEIALTMGVTVKTVDYHIRTLKTKLGTSTRGELIRAGIARGLT